MISEPDSVEGYGNRERMNRMEECREYEQEIDLKDLLFHILYHWRSVLLVALAAGALWAGYAVWYNTESLPGKRAEAEAALEQQLQLRDLLKAQEQGQEAAAGQTVGQEQAAELQKAKEQGLTAEQAGKQAEELRVQLEALKERSPARNFAMGFAAGFFVTVFCYGMAYVFSDKLRGERELRERYGYYILGVFPRGGRRRLLGFVDRMLERLEGTRERPSKEEMYRIISVNMMKLAGDGGTFLVTGTVGRERLQGFVDDLVQYLREDMALVAGADMNVTADTLEALGECDGVVLVEQRGKSLRRQVHREHESIAAFGKRVVGYVVL